MANTEQSIIVGIFDNASRADEAIAALQRAGFRNDQIQRSSEENEERGLFAGVKELFSSEKRAQKDVSQDLIHLGMEPDEARIYQQEYESHHPLVSVTSSDRIQDAGTILQNHGAYSPHRNMGMSNAAPGTQDVSQSAASPYADTKATGTGASANVTEEQRMRLHAEQLRAYKQPVQTGEVTLHKEIVTEQQTINVPVTHEEVVVERHSLAEDAATAEPIEKEEIVRIPVSEEQINVSKQTVTTGEVTLRKRKVEETRQFSDTVQHEEARIEQEGDVPIWDSNANPPPSAQPGV